MTNDILLITSKRSLNMSQTSEHGCYHIRELTESLRVFLCRNILRFRDERSRRALIGLI